MFRAQILYKPGRWADYAAPGGEPDLWTDPAAAAFARTDDLLLHLGSARRPHEGGYAYRLPPAWRPASLYDLARAELMPQGYAVRLRGAELHVRYVGAPLAAAERVLAVCRRVNRRHGRGAVARLEFVGPDRGHAVVEVGRGREEYVPF